MDAAVLATVTVAVTVPAFIPKLTLLELLKTTVPELALSVPAEMATPPPAATLAVMVFDPDIPKVTPLELANWIVPVVAVWVPAAIPTGGWTFQVIVALCPLTDWLSETLDPP